MNIFVAGGTGTIGLPLVRALVAAGHQVTATTRSERKVLELRSAGATATVVDALDRTRLMAAVSAARPTHVIHQLTAIPREGPRRASDLEPTNRLRIDGTRNLLDATVAAGARRFLAGSFALLSSRGQASAAPVDAAAGAVQSMEAQILEATAQGRIEGVVLRYGMFYGPQVPSTRSMIDRVRRRRLPIIRGDISQLPLIHVDDAVSATVCALDAAPPGSVYDIVDDRAMSLAEIVSTIAAYAGAPTPYRVPAWLARLVAPYVARMTSVRLPLSNAPARQELGWQPRYATIRDGLRPFAQRAA